MRARSFMGLALVITLALTGCGGKGENQLSGVVTMSGTPLAGITLVVVAPDGKTAGGSTNANGEYLIPDPPVGLLKFQFIAPPRQGGKPIVPAKYASPESGITFEYKGGKKVHDIELQP